MKKKERILFDFDGTLFDTAEGVTRCAAYALSHFGIEEDWHKITFFVGPPLEYSFSHYYGFSREDCDRAIKIYRERYHTQGLWELKPYPGLTEALTSLRKKGYSLGVASSKPEHMCIRILENQHMRSLFDDVCGADDQVHRSIKRDVLLEAMRRTGDPANADALVLVGDTGFDVRGASEVSMDCIGVSYGFGDVEEMKAEGAIAICDSMEEIDAFFPAKI